MALEIRNNSCKEAVISFILYVVIFVTPWLCAVHILVETVIDPKQRDSTGENFTFEGWWTIFFADVSILLLTTEIFLFPNAFFLLPSFGEIIIVTAYVLSVIVHHNFVVNCIFFVCCMIKLIIVMFFISFAISRRRVARLPNVESDTLIEAS